MTSLEQHLAAHREVGVDPDNNWSTVCICGTVIADEYADVDVDALHNAHVAAAWREVRTVRTVEELDALPAMTVVRGADEFVWERNSVPNVWGDLQWEYVGDSDPQDRPDIGPWTVLWTPEDGAL